MKNFSLALLLTLGLFPQKGEGVNPPIQPQNRNTLIAVPKGAPSHHLSPEEWTFLNDYLKIVADQLLEQLDTLPEAVMTKRPKDGGWTIAECYDHILKVERGLLEKIRAVMEKPAEAPNITRELDAWLIAKVSDRGNKVETSVPLSVATTDKTVISKIFKDTRGELQNFLADHADALRMHYGDSLYGKVDAYQLVLVLAAHTMRHYHQIQENLRE